MQSVGTAVLSIIRLKAARAVRSWRIGTRGGGGRITKGGSSGGSLPVCRYVAEALYGSARVVKQTHNMHHSS